MRDQMVETDKVLGALIHSKAQKLIAVALEEGKIYLTRFHLYDKINLDGNRREVD
ncbi:MAG: hypothetical protein AB1797_11030 [bacterium]